MKEKTTIEKYVQRRKEIVKQLRLIDAQRKTLNKNAKILRETMLGWDSWLLKNG